MFDLIVPVNDDDTLYLSGVIHDWKPVHDLGITVVVDLEGDIDHGVPTAADQFLYIYLPIHDGGLPQLDRLHSVAQLGAMLTRRGHRLLAHCGMGLNRSALLCALIMMYNGMTGPDAVARLQQRRPGALYNDIFAEYVRTATLLT